MHGRRDVADQDHPLALKPGADDEVSETDPDCESAWGPDADRRAKLLIYRAVEGSLLDAYSQMPPRSV